MIVDAHAHLGPWPRFGVTDKSVEAYLSVMDHLGIGVAVVSHHAALCGLLQDGAELSRAAYEQSGGRILSFLVYDPNRPDESLRIIEADASRTHVVGIKVHPTLHLCSADDARYRPAWEAARKWGLVVMAHSWDRAVDHPAQGLSFPDLYESYLRAYPEVRFIFGHGGGRYNGFISCARLVAQFPNAYLDISGDGFMMGRLEYLVSQVGSKKILYGSDAPWFDPRLGIGEVLAADVTDEDRDNILGRNATSLFGLAEEGA